MISRGNSVSRLTARGPRTQPLRNVVMRPRAFQRVQAVQAPVSSKPLLGPAIAMPNVNKYSFLLPARWGLSTARTEASVTLNGDNYEVEIRVPKADLDKLSGGRQPYVHWGLFRASPTAWNVPNTVRALSAPEGPDTTNDHRAYQPDPGAMRTPLRKLHDQATGVTYYELRLAIPRNLAPLTFAFTIHVQKDEGAGKKEAHFKPRHLKHCTLLLGASPGRPEPFGATLLSTTHDGKTDRHTINFATFSKHAKGMTLVLIRRKDDSQTPSKGYLEIALDPNVNRTGGVWHLCVEGLKDLNTLYWGWRAEGATDFVEGGGKFDASRILLDPYATQVEEFDQPQGMPTMVDYDGTPLKLLLGCLGGVAGITESDRSMTNHSASTSTPAPETHNSTRCLAIHIPTFSNHPSVPQDLRGTYPGVAKRIPELHRLGVNCVVLAQVLMSRDGMGPLGKAPVSYFAPDSSMAAGINPAWAGANMEAARQLRQLITDLKASGIRVLMQISFSFTAEQEGNKLMLSLRGLDNMTYYRAGGVLNCGHPTVEKLIADAVRHWRLTYGVDGFYIALPEPLVMSDEGIVQDASRAAELFAFEPQLANGATIVVGGSLPDLLPRGGVRGFPHYARLAEAPGRFQDLINQYLLGNHRNMLSDVATRLAGSADLCSESWESGLPGNLAAGRNAARGAIWNAPVRPGGGHLVSFCEESVRNLGVPEPYASDRVLSLARAAILMSAVARGVPLYTVGEDFLMSPSHAMMRDRLLEWTMACMDLRERNGSLFSGKLGARGVVLKCLGADGYEPVWMQEGPDLPVGANVIALSLTDSTKALYVAFNPHNDPVTVRLPTHPFGTAPWIVSLDTMQKEDGTPQFGSQIPQNGHYNMMPGTAIALEALTY